MVAFAAADLAVDVSQDADGADGGGKHPPRLLHNKGIAVRLSNTGGHLGVAVSGKQEANHRLTHVPCKWNNREKGCGL